MPKKNINTEYDFSNFGVGKYKNESSYVADKVKEGNSKEAGKGDAWEVKWQGAKKTLFPEKFEKLINDVMEKKGQKYGNFPTAKYTVIVKTTFLEPGYNIGISKKPAYINLEVSFVETANKSKVVAVYYLTQVPGSDAMGFDFDASGRISESYAKSGKMVGKELLKTKK